MHALDPRVRPVPALVREYVGRLRSALGSMVVDARLFGSWARGEADETSDVDVLVVLRASDRHARRVAHDLAADLSFELGVMISPTVFDRQTWSTHLAQGRPLPTTIAREGIPL
jgi:predicted nucleotidyltransferase